MSLESLENRPHLLGVFDEALQFEQLLQVVLLEHLTESVIDGLQKPVLALHSLDYFLLFLKLLQVLLHFLVDLVLLGEDISSGGLDFLLGLESALQVAYLVLQLENELGTLLFGEVFELLLVPQKPLVVAVFAENEGLLLDFLFPLRPELVQLLQNVLRHGLIEDDSFLLQALHEVVAGLGHPDVFRNFFGSEILGGIREPHFPQIPEISLDVREFGELSVFVRLFEHLEELADFLFQSPVFLIEEFRFLALFHRPGVGRLELHDFFTQEGVFLFEYFVLLQHQLLSEDLVVAQHSLLDLLLLNRLDFLVFVGQLVLQQFVLVQ